ncbi:head-tail connector protein [Streptomyces sp. NPDC046977]|uniref:head-tail connector protein n=1 Tax=Streptomyces sp. NPDC046977 TaxID=3154703 RepID=UPI0033CC8EA8
MALLTLDEAKAQLDIDTTASDTELEAYIEALTAVIERHIGPVEAREVSEVVEGRGPVLCLSTIPVLSLTSATPLLAGGEALNVGDLVVDLPRGLVRRRSGGSFAGGLWTLVYQVGRGEVLPTINLAARILLQHLWRTQYGAARGGGSADDFSVNEPIPGFGYAVPNRVLQLLEPYKLPPGVA